MSKLKSVLPVLSFVILAYVVLLGCYPDMLYTAQDRNEFFLTTDFFQQLVGRPFGLMMYLGAYLTQYFYYPALGTTLLILLWVLIYYVGIKAFRLGATGSAFMLLPLCCLLASITNVGYWIYIMFHFGHWFSQSLAFLCILLMLWAARLTPRSFRGLWLVLGVVLTYPLLGWMSLFFALILFLSECFSRKDSRMPLWQNLLGLGIAAITPFLWGRLVYTHMHITQVLRSGFPYFESTTVSAIRPSIPFFFLIAFTFCIAVLSAYLSDREVRWTRKLHLNLYTSTLLSLLAGGLLLWQTMFWDYNFQAEMRMNRAAMEDDWSTIIAEAEKAPHLSRTMVVLKNIALMNTGELGNRSFALDNSGLDIYNPDSLNLNVMQIAVPMIYLNYGKVQFATRWCMENAVGYGFSPYFLKLFIRAAQETGEQKVIRRYQHLLSLTTFHGDWRPVPPTRLVRELHVGFSDVIDADHNDCERYLIENFSLAFGSDRPIIKELNLFYSMIYRDPRNFWQAFHVYASQTGGAHLPIHYQEAYLIMNENYPVQLPYQVEISPVVKQAYQQYKYAVNSYNGQNLSNDELGEILRPAWKHTYWWYIMYGRTVY